MVSGAWEHPLKAQIGRNSRSVLGRDSIIKLSPCGSATNAVILFCAGVEVKVWGASCQVEGINICHVQGPSVVGIPSHTVVLDSEGL